jgi:hypothetical protein
MAPAERLPLVGHADKTGLQLGAVTAGGMPQGMHEDERSLLV